MSNWLSINNSKPAVASHGHSQQLTSPKILAFCKVTVCCSLTDGCRFSSGTAQLCQAGKTNVSNLVCCTRKRKNGVPLGKQLQGDSATSCYLLATVQQISKSFGALQVGVPAAAGFVKLICQTSLYTSAALCFWSAAAACSLWSSFGAGH